MSISWITYKKERILSVKYPSSDENELFEFLDELSAFVLNNNSPLYMLSDLSYINLVGKQGLIKEFINHGKEISRLIKKKAVIGVSTNQLIYVKGFRTITGIITCSFSSSTEAKEWLVSERDRYGNIRSEITSEFQLKNVN